MANMEIDGVTYTTDAGLFVNREPNGNFLAELVGNSGGYYKAFGANREMAVNNLAAMLKEMVPSTWHDNTDHF